MKLETRIAKLEAAEPPSQPDIFTVGTGEDAAMLAEDRRVQGKPAATILVTGNRGRPVQSAAWADMLPVIAEHGRAIHCSSPTVLPEFPRTWSHL